MRILGSEYVLCDMTGLLLSNDPDSTDNGVLINNLRPKTPRFIIELKIGIQLLDAVERWSKKPQRHKGTKENKTSSFHLYSKPFHLQQHAMRTGQVFAIHVNEHPLTEPLTSETLSKTMSEKFGSC